MTHYFKARVVENPSLLVSRLTLPMPPGAGARARTTTRGANQNAGLTETVNPERVNIFCKYIRVNASIHENVP